MFRYLIVAGAILSQTALCASYHSQFEQDRWVNENIFHNQRDGVFIDIGAHDGQSLSNTLFFEEDLNWTGICIEPIPEVFQQLRERRNCICVNGGIAAEETVKEFLRGTGRVEMLSGFVDKYDPRHLQRVQNEMQVYGGSCQVIKVPTYNLNKLLREHGLSTVDFLSLDTEGGELDILKSIDFSSCRIRVITVENNYDDHQISDFLESKGYQKIAALGCDEVFVLPQ